MLNLKLKNTNYFILDKAIPLARELWIQLWSKGQKVFEDADLKEVLKRIGVTNGDQLLKESKDPKVAQELENNTQEAIDQGVNNLGTS